MANDLVFERTGDGLIVRLDDPPIPVGEWTARADGSPGLGMLIRLRDDGEAFERGGGLLAPWRSVAGLTSDELRITGLPDAAPFTLEVAATGALHDEDFEIRCGFVRDGRRVVGVERQGAWLRVAGDDFVLLDPLYAIAEAIKQFRQGAADIESRMLRWARIAERLPADAIVDGHLGSLRIAVASSFRLEPFVNAAGEPDFDPVVGRRETCAAAPGEEKQVFAGVLPIARQQEFARRFRGLSRVKHRYAVGGGGYVVLTPNVEHALGAVRRAQAGTDDERRDFLKHVHGRLRAALDGDGTDEPPALDDIFDDDRLSERVDGVGIWVDKVLPWITQAKEPWMPPETFGLRIGEHQVTLAEDELPGVLDRVKSAVARGERTVRIADVVVPATPATVEAVEALVRRAQPVERPAGDDGAQASCEPDGSGRSDRVLVVIDNLETVGFRRERQRRISGIANVRADLKTDLLPHQQAGIAWLAGHWEAGSWGALLADDMGLGKTLEALAFLACVQRHARASDALRRPMLVVAPTGLLKNWKDEHDRHLSAPGLGRVVEAHGAALRHLRDPNARIGSGGEPALGRRLSDRRDDERSDGAQPGLDAARLLSVLDIKELENADWVLTTYETLRDYQFSFGRVAWSVVVFDEAQKIKNPSARLTDAALAMNVDFALLMTGTPVENRPADVWSLLDRAEPGRFGPLKAFSRKYESDADRAVALAALHRELTQPADLPASASGPGRPAPALMLRRLKADHLSDLPGKEVHRCVVEMPPRQAEAYTDVVLDGTIRGNMLQVLHRLRSISLHPFAPRDADIDAYIRASARLSETFRILEQAAARNEKVLIFVEAREMQGFLITALRRRFTLAEDVLVINGAVSGRTRKARVDKFQTRAGFDAMVLSPRAGGVGLTLTAANHVVHLSRWWNPAVEDQCTDRVFRIGQRREVHVHLPIARHPDFRDYSFDVKLDALMERKRDMNRRVLAPTAATSADMDDLFRSTVQQARGGAEDRDAPDAAVDIDLLEPLAFETWVLGQLQAAGYETRRTPHSRDRGADGLAISGADGARHTLVVQCKHTQPDVMCGRAAVEEVLRSIRGYDKAIQGDPRPMVVTNAAGFTLDADRLARQEGVRLVHRGGLAGLRTFR